MKIAKSLSNNASKIYDTFKDQVKNILTNIDGIAHTIDQFK